MQDNADQKQKHCLVTEQTRFTDNNVRNSTHFEGENIVLAQVDKVPTQAVSLIFSNCSLYSCKGLNFHVRVTHLDLSSNFLDSLAGLSGLNLEYVDLSGNLLTDVSALSTCNKIQVLKLNNNQIFKLDLVQNLLELTQLEFENNQVQFLKPVITHQNFQVKWLSAQKLVLIQQLMELLNVSKEEAIIFQSECELWKYIALMLIRYRDKVINGSLAINDDQQLTSIGFVDYLNVTKLILNKCHKINFTEAPMKLRDLQVCVSKVQSLQGIERFQQLETLVFRNNSLHRLQNEMSLLTELANLKLLNLAQNQLQEVCSFENLIKLENLDLSENKLKRINLLVGPKLKNLDVSFNQLENADELKDCDSLEQLNIANNKITNINILNNLTNLVYFNISNNRILSIKVCLQMKSLVDIRTNQNVIQDLDELTKHQNSCANWFSEQDNPVDEEIKELFNCDEEDVQKKKLELLTQQQQSNYIPQMIVKYGMHVINESLEIKNDDQIISLAFSDLLKVNNTLSIFECENISFEPHPKLVQHLRVSDCQLKNVLHLDQITQLVSLDLSGNSLRYASEIRELVLLQRLTLKDNKIAQIDWVSELKVLEHINMENNKLLTVKQLLDLPQLKTVLLNGNMALDVDYLKRHKNYTNIWRSVQVPANISDFEYYLGDNKNDKMVKDFMNQLQLEKYSLENAAKYENLINNQGLVIHGDDFLHDLGFIDPTKNFIKRNTNIITISFCKNVDTLNTPRNLTKLTIDNSLLSKINGIELAQRLVSLNLSQNNLTSVQQLENLVNIEELFLSDNKITKLDCLQNLINLKTLEVKNNKLLELNVALFWTHIVKLFVDNNIINDFTALFNHMSYNPMWISRQNIATIADINNYNGQEATQSQIDAELAKYNNRSVQKRKVDQQQILAYKKNIRNKCLEITDNPEITTINFVNHFRLIKLTIKNCQNVRFDYVCNVTTLHVTNSGLTKLDGIQKMKQLTDLNLGDNKLTDASLLADLVKLENLDVSNNRLIEVDFVVQLNQLRKLSLKDNLIYHWNAVKQHKNYNDWIVSQNKPTENDILNRFGAELLKEEILILQKQFIEPNAIVEQKKLANYENKIQLKTWITVINVSENESNQILEIYKYQCDTFGRNVRIECDQKDLETVLNQIKNINATFKVEVEEFRLLKLNDDNELLEDPSFVNGFNIQKLVLWECKNVKLHGVANVKALHANLCGLQSIEGIQNWNHLSELYLICNKLESITQLENLTQLKVLSLFYNNIQNVEPLRGLVNLKTLSLSTNQIQNVEPLKDLVNLRDLDLSSNPSLNLDSLRGFVNLTTLKLSSNRIQNVEPLKDLVNLRDLDLSSNPSLNLDSLRGFVNLTTLKLSSNRLVNLEPLRGLVNLTHLDLGSSSLYNSKNQIQNVEPLRGLVNLKSLSLSTNQIQNVEPLRGLVNLKTLSLDSNLIQNVEPLRGLVNLKSLSLSTNQIQNVEPLRGLLNLRDLDLSSNPSLNLDSLRGFVNLTTLKLSSNRIQNVEPLKDLVNLMDLSLSTNQIQNMEPLRGLVNLKSLSLSTNQIQNMEPLKDLVNLMDLSLSTNQIQNMEPLRGLLNLRDLDLSSNPSLNLDSLRGFVNLTTLKLSSNRIQNVEPLKDLVNLRDLSLSTNQIQNVEPLRGLVNLKTLSLSTNQIQNVEPLRGLVNLKTLSLSTNQIQNVEPLRGLVNLRDLDLQNSQIKDFSPIQNHPNFKNYKTRGQE
ncbi:leucine-rich_repeat domain-containing protein [Hexamita inflata]|uniref:Leucine-rich repeat domain-containing protein n=1 Tax=Hexamita inflata TaxID=28002 RepID=A0AA86TZT9_9EUKA|nr:leucine-rich repeat domain-containing protein [Hexamita inflata]